MEWGDRVGYFHDAQKNRICSINSVKKVRHRLLTDTIKQGAKLGASAAFWTEPALKR